MILSQPKLVKRLSLRLAANERHDAHESSCEAFPEMVEKSNAFTVLVAEPKQWPKKKQKHHSLIEKGVELLDKFNRYFGF